MGKKRLLYLDNLRSVAMLFGLPVHAALLSQDNVMRLFETLSYFFRMGTFFTVSGFFAALVLSQRGSRDFIRSRILMLGLPLVTIAILLNPVSIALVRNLWLPGEGHLLSDTIDILAGRGPEQLFFLNWHLHLWFLVSLLVYALCAPAALALIDRCRQAAPVRNLAKLIPDAMIPLFIAIAIAVTVICLRGFERIALKPFDPAWLVGATMTYAPYFFLGMVLFREEWLWRRLHTIDIPLIALALVTLALYQTLDLSVMASAILGEFRRGVTICAALFAILYLFEKLLDSSNHSQQSVSSSIYTVYLFHYFFIFLYGNIWIQWARIDWIVAPTLIVIAAFFSSYFIHRICVMRSSFLMLMLNGKRTVEPTRVRP